jgi:hypothetical protein
MNPVEHPARVEGGPALALAEWAPSYRRATCMQAPRAVGGLAALTACLAGAGRGWRAGGLLLLGVVPFTLLIIMPTNRALLAPGAGQDLGRTVWNRLHAIRTAWSDAASARSVRLVFRGAPGPGAP